MKHRLATIGLWVIACAIASALLSPLIAPEIGEFSLAERLRGPTWESPFGKDPDGRDLLPLILQGTRLSLLISFSTVFLSLLFGVSIGLLAGYRGGRWDTLFSFITDAILSFPSLLLIIALAAFQREGSIVSVVMILSAVGWVGYARITRGQVLSLKEREFVLAARGSGASTFRICLRHLLPNAIGPILVSASFGLAGVILAESTLSFLGLGLPPDVPSWGRLLDQGVQYLLVAPHLSIFPGLAIALMVFSFNVVGEGLRDRFDVKEVARCSRF